MELEQLTEDQKGLIATRDPLTDSFPPKPEHLPDGHWLMERGWFDRSVPMSYVVFGVSDRGVAIASSSASRSPRRRRR